MPWDVWLVILLFVLLVSIITYFIFKHLQSSAVMRKLECAVKERRFAEAEQLALQARKLKEDPFWTDYYLAVALDGQTKYAESVRVYEKALLKIALQKSEFKSAIKLRIGEIYFKLDKWKEALGYFELVLSENPKEPRARFQSALIYYNIQKYVKAKKILEEYVREYPGHIEAKLLLARCLLELHEPGLVVNNLVKILSSTGLFPNLELEAREILADAYFYSKNYEKASLYYEALIEEPSVLNDPEKRYGVIEHALMCLIMLDRIKDAIRFFQNVSNGMSRQKKSDLLYGMARILMKQGHFYDAISLTHVIYKNNPKYKDVELTVKRYGPLLENPYLKLICSRDKDKAVNLISRCLRIESLQERVVTPHYIILIEKERSHVINTTPFELLLADCQAIKNKLEKAHRLQYPIFFYSYLRLSEQGELVFNNQEIHTVYGTDFVHVFEVKE